MADPTPDDALALSIVLPVYNEERTLETTFRTLRSYLEGLGRSYEVVCVNDGAIYGWKHQRTGRAHWCGNDRGMRNR